MPSKAIAKRVIFISLTALGISACGAVLAFLIHHIYSDIHDVSPIDIVVVPDEDDPAEDDPLTTITKITHKGKEAVSNFHFTLRTPKNITDHSNFTSVKNINVGVIAPNVLTVSVLRFGPGPGSVIELYTTINGSETSDYDNYWASAVYDQGSIKRESSAVYDKKGSLRELRYFPWWEDASHQFNSLDITMRKSILVGSIIVVLSILAFLIAHFFDSLKVIYRDARRKLR
jgi:hypothetical protein